ncbi:unnamed protein product, partial [Iphiclides podalirius]
MNTKALVLLAIGTLAIGLVATQTILCGRRLAETMASICESEMVIKKSVPSSIEDYDYSWQWLAPRLAHRLSQSTSQSRTKRGIVSECCEKPCTRDELLNYC